MKWLWIKNRERLRWLFRSTNFVKLEADIVRLSQPLSLNTLPEKRAARLRRRVQYLISCLPPELAASHHDTMDRYGHSVRT